MEKDPLYVVRDAMSKAAVKEKMNRLAKLKAAYDWIVEERYVHRLRTLYL